MHSTPNFSFVSSQPHRSSPQYNNFPTTLNSVDIPQILQEALGDRNWVQAIKEERIEKN